jgi:hypothetical protein
MTYEPGQQVLVRGQIRGKHSRNIDEILGWTVAIVGDFGQIALIDVAAADVVGPATPDEGLLHQLAATEGVLATVEAERDEARAALAAAEAERDALRTRIAEALDLVNRLYNAGQLGAINAEWMIRRTLSVEAAGMEGGGECVCPKFNDTGGYRIADRACPIHGVKGSNPGDWLESTRRVDEETT